MKTEYEIAKENVKLKEDSKTYLGLEEDKKHYTFIDGSVFLHKQTCQRFLDFLKKVGCQDKKDIGLCRCIVCEKEKDLKNAIKYYEDKGI